MTTHKDKNDTAANKLMELALLQYHSQCPLRLTHTYREQNTWADQLTRENYSDSDMPKRFQPDDGSWHTLDQLHAATKLRA